MTKTHSISCRANTAGLQNATWFTVAILTHQIPQTLGRLRLFGDAIWEVTFWFHNDKKTGDMFLSAGGNNFDRDYAPTRARLAVNSEDEAEIQLLFPARPSDEWWAAGELVVDSFGDVLLNEDPGPAAAPKAVLKEIDL